MGVPIGQNGLEMANFDPKLGLWEPRFGVGDPRSRVWEAQIRDQGPQIWPILAKFVVPRQISPLGDRILVSKEAKTPLIWPKRPILGVPAWKR